MLDAGPKGKKEKKPEMIVRNGYLKVLIILLQLTNCKIYLYKLINSTIIVFKTHQTDKPEQMFTEDLASVEHITEDKILEILEERLRIGHYHTFLGDVMLIMNPNEEHDVYGPHVSFVNKKKKKTIFRAT